MQWTGIPGPFVADPAQFALKEYCNKIILNFL
jgi:hypothetical protein